MRRELTWAALAAGCLAVLFGVNVALAGPGSGATGPGGGCPTATATSPGCVTTTTIANQSSYTATGAGPQWNCSLATATCDMRSSINAATAGAGTPAFSLTPTATLDADDVLLMLYQVAGGSSVFQIDLEGDTVAGGAIQYGNTNGNLTSASAATMKLQSSTTDATTSGTVGAITLKSGADITATDLLLDVQDSAGAHALTVTEAGAAVALASLGTASGSGCGLHQATGNLLSFSGSASACSAGVYMSAPSGSGPLKLAINSANEFQWTSTEFAPDSASGSSLGTTTLPWSDIAGDTSMRGSCTLNNATPSTCTATVTVGAYCTCSIVGATAAIAAQGCAVDEETQTNTILTITSGAVSTAKVVYHCIL